MSDFSKDVKPENDRRRLTATLARLPAADSSISSPSRLRVKDAGDAKGQE
jgi:hypothetical protein